MSKIQLMVIVDAEKAMVSDDQKNFIRFFNEVEISIETKLNQKKFFSPPLIEGWTQNYYSCDLPNEFMWKSYCISRVISQVGDGNYVCSFTSYHNSFLVTKQIEETDLGVLIEKVSDHLVKMYKLSSTQYDYLGETKNKLI